MQCNQCGQTNRPGARFCTRCGASLNVGAVSKPGSSTHRGGPVTPGRPNTLKVCPQCKTHNRWGANVCTHCGYRFGRQPAQPTPQAVARKVSLARRLKHRWWVGGVGLLLVVLFLGVRHFTADVAAPPSAMPTPVSISPTAAPQPASTISVVATATPNVLQQAVVSVLQIIVPNDAQPNSAAMGSGSVVSAHGHILTNFHVLGDVQTRQLHNRDSLILIAVPPLGQSAAAPVIRYRAVLVKADYDLDLALLQISATEDGRALPPDLGLTPLPIGDSDTVQIGDELTIIGYPGLGGATVTITRGIVAGYLPNEGWLKTDAEISPGNSGGAAINRAGQLVGVPSAETRVALASGQLGLVRPSNLAQALLILAQ